MPEPAPDRPGSGGARIDIRGAIEAIPAVPGLWMLIGLAAFNNLLAGVFMSLTDAYGLSLVSVETWGLLFGFISLAFIAGGVVVAKVGLGRSPLRVILVGNLVNWTICVLFPVWDSIIPLVLGMTVWLALIPAIEAAEQTVLQRAIPFERQGRVFGFAQLVENAAAPVTALAMGPLAESVFMPSADDGWIADTIGSWWGTGAARGLAVMFTLAGLVGVVVTVLALGSRAYRRLAKTVDEAVSSDGNEDDAPEAPCPRPAGGVTRLVALRRLMIGAMVLSAPAPGRSRVDVAGSGINVGLIRSVAIYFNPLGGTNAEWLPDRVTVNGVTFSNSTWFLKGAPTYRALST